MVQYSIAEHVSVQVEVQVTADALGRVTVTGNSVTQTVRGNVVIGYSYWYLVTAARR